ncbi:hypothetical protein [Azospirillum canadense]|uniref:hypothetical protein n=1 Tax=Azospirillum canadense TaxID=403962 RepID=UPI002226FAB9|nr:hypothetical protein [Azospirillum canadense]MCW2237369.1 threonine dehydratase [Azospirillum canadense]
MARLLSFLALLVLIAGLPGGGAVPLRAPEGMHHAQPHVAFHPQAVDAASHCGTPDEAPCDHPDTPAAPGRDHAHATAGCLCLTGACDLAGLPVRVGAPFAHRVAAVLPGGEDAPAAVAHAPPLPPPRA